MGDIDARCEMALQALIAESYAKAMIVWDENKALYEGSDEEHIVDVSTSGVENIPFA